MKDASLYFFLILSLGLLVLIESRGQVPEAKSWMPEARLTIRVLDELAAPVQGATVRLGFQDKTTGDMKLASGSTDSLGKFTGQGGTVGVVGCDARKEGYYISGAAIPHFTNAAAMRWQPWDATYTSVLRKIENPIPMYAKWADMKTPEADKACGYDLKVGDWVSPWGKGLVPDFVFTVSCDYTNSSRYNVTMKLSFSNPLDGIQAAELSKEYAYGEFIWHRQAPDAGYGFSYEQERGLPKQHYQIPTAPAVRRSEDIEKQKFYFRVRTVERDGKIVSALYGKLSQGFDQWASKSTNVSIRTCYYLNPTPLDRNMEFDLKRNLFKNLKFEEQPRKP